MAVEFENEKVTWRQIKDFLNTCSEDQLEHEVVLIREEETMRVHCPHVAEEDYIIDNEDAHSGCFLRSDADTELTDERPEDIEVIYPKGTIMFFENF